MGLQGIENSLHPAVGTPHPCFKLEVMYPLNYQRSMLRGLIEVRL